MSATPCPQALPLRRRFSPPAPLFSLQEAAHAAAAAAARIQNELDAAKNAARASAEVQAELLVARQELEDAKAVAKVAALARKQLEGARQESAQLAVSLLRDNFTAVRAQRADQRRRPLSSLTPLRPCLACSAARGSPEGSTLKYAVPCPSAGPHRLSPERA